MPALAETHREKHPEQYSKDGIYMPQKGEKPPPLYAAHLIEPKKRLTLLQHCYKEPWVPIGQC